MGAQKTFKWQRALPIADATHQPPFGRYNLKKMRQIPTAIFSAGATGIDTAIVSVYVPANSWGLNKNLLIRTFYHLHIPPIGGPPIVSFTESFHTAQFGTITLPVSAPVVIPAGDYSTWIQRNLVRIDPLIYGTDLGDSYDHNWLNDYDQVLHVIPISATAPPFDYTTQIQIDLQVNVPIAAAGTTIQALWAEAFLEQAINLGSLP